MEGPDFALGYAVAAGLRAVKHAATFGGCVDGGLPP
jgi:hypothetical protein